MSLILDVLLPLNKEEYFLAALNSTKKALLNIPGQGRILILDTRLPENRNLIVKSDSVINVIQCPGELYEEAIRFGLDYVEAEYVALMNDDDFCHPKRFRLQLKKIASINGDLSICKMVKTDNKLNRVLDFNIQPLLKYNASCLLIGPYGANATLLAKRNWFISRMEIRVEGVWDWNFALENYPSSKIAYVAKGLYKYRTHEKQITQTVSHQFELVEHQATIVQKYLLRYQKTEINSNFVKKILFPKIDRLKRDVKVKDYIKFYKIISKDLGGIERVWLFYQVVARYTAALRLFRKKV